MTAVLLTAGLSCTALAAEENILATISGFDPTFESGITLGPVPFDVLNTAGVEGTALADSGHDGSIKSLKMTAVGDKIQINAPVEPASNYTFSFWMKNSKANSLQMQRGAFLFVNADENNKTRKMVNRSERFDWMLPARNGYVGTTGENDTYFPASDYTFGIERLDDAANEWRQVSVNFSTPVEAAKNVELILACVAEDPVLAIDDLTLVKTDCEPNFIFNGNMEAIRKDGDINAFTAFFIPSNETNSKTEIVTDPETDNTYLRVTFNGATWRTNWQLIPSNVLFAKGKTFGTRYKISFKAKGEGTVGTSPSEFLSVTVRRSDYTSSNGWTQDYNLGKASDEWKTYTMYIDATEAVKNEHALNKVVLDSKDFSFWLVRYIYQNFAVCIDDVSSWYDKSNIGFFKTLDFNYADAEETNRYFDFVNKYATDKGVTYLNSIVTTESSIETAKISDLPEAADGSRKVIVRAHYLPEATWGTSDAETKITPVSFIETDVTLLSAVYKHEGGKKTLVDVKIQNGTSSAKGETIDVVDEVNIPAITGSETYSVESMAWDMNGMKPIMDKAILGW